jgi:PAS domain S-box-containing protein
MINGEKKRSRIRQFLTALFAGLIFALIVLYTWKLSADEIERERAEQITSEAGFISSQLINEVDRELNRLKNLKERAELNGAFFEDQLEFEASLIADESPAIRFIQWIDSGMEVSTTAETAGFTVPEFTDPALNDIRRAYWRQAQQDSSLTISQSFSGETEASHGNANSSETGNNLFIIDIPVHIDDSFAGTITAGLDFSEVFDSVVQSREMFHITLTDEAGHRFYDGGVVNGNSRYAELTDNRQLRLPVERERYWYASITPNSYFSEATIDESLRVNLILGLLLSLLMAVGIYFIIGFYSAKESYDFSNRKLRTVVAASPLAIFVVNKKGVVTGFWNRSAEQMFGYKTKEVKGQYLPHITREPALEYQEMLEMVLKGKPYKNVESKRVRKDGTEFSVKVHAALVRTVPGQAGDVVVMIEDVTRQKETESELKHEKQFADTVMKSQPGLFYVIDEKRRLVRWNSNVNDFLGMSDEELSGMNFLEIFIEDERLRVLENLQNASYSGSLEMETVVRSKGSTYDFYINGTLMKIGRRRYLVGNGINITERNKIRNELQRSVDEKDVLLTEIHHRVKNNLAIIANLIDIQLLDVDDETMTEVLRETQNRIFSIAGVHEMLYDVNSFSRISFREYLQKLFDRIFDMYDKDHKMTGLDMQVKVDYLNINQAIPLGLMLTELLTNSFKHAFDSKKAGMITIEITGGPDLIHVVYKDNGNGFNPDLFENSTSMGMILIRSLLKQLKAEYSVKGNSGFELSFSFTMQMRGSHSTMT